MDSYKMPILVFLIVCTNCVSGLDIPNPDNLVVNIWDAEVITVWDPPMDAPSKSQYNVQLGKYGLDWANVASCTRITVTYCDLTNLISDYSFAYKVRVQLVAGEDVSRWTIIRRFYPNQSNLQPPSFTLLATSSTLTVKVHKKPILGKVFPYGLTYTIYLEERGHANKTTTAYLKDGEKEDQATQTFDSLRWGREYCISLSVEGIGTLSKSNVSPKQCLLLPEQEWYIVAVSSLSTLSVMAVIAVLLIILCCFLRRPENTPPALKSPRSGWYPLSVGDGPMEVVTDKGWYLISKTEVKNCVAKEPVTPQATVKKEVREDRSSMDSGVSTGSNSATKDRGNTPMRQEDSGCGSMGGSETSASCRSSAGGHPMQEGRLNINTARKREDSGVGLGCQLDCSVSLDGQDSGPEKEPAAGDDYRSQSPSAVQIHVCDGDETLKQIIIHPDTVLADVVTGYRAGHQSCICSGAGQCAWCHKTGQYGTEEIRQYRATCIENGLLNSKNHFDHGEHTLPSYWKTHLHMETVVSMDDFETSLILPHIQLEETFPLLTALSSLSQVEGEQNCSMTNMSLSLCDVELKTD